MSKVYFTLTGTKHYFGKEFLKKGTKIRLEKEPDNEHDKEAIKVTYEGLGKIGYVANSSYTVKVIYEQKKYFMHYRGYIYVILEMILKVKNLPKAT